MSLDVRHAAGTGRRIQVDGSNWMAALDPSLPLAELTIPGSHNAGATKGGRWVACQSSGIDEQLAMGVRYLDIRVRPRRGGLAVFHGTTHQGLSLVDVLQQCREFLAASPTESVLLCLTQEGTKLSCRELAPLWMPVRRAFDDILSDPRRPSTLGRSRGRVVVVTRDPAIAGIDQGRWVIQDDWHIPDARTWHARKWPAITDQLRRARAARGDGRMWSCFASSNGWALPPHLAARLANPALAEHFAELAPTRAERNGIVVVDFAEPELVALLASRNLGRGLGGRDAIG